MTTVEVWCQSPKIPSGGYLIEFVILGLDPRIHAVRAAKRDAAHDNPTIA